MADEPTTTSEAGTGNDAGTSTAPGGSPPLPNSQPTTPPATTPDDGKQFTQADLDKHAGRRAAEAKRAAAKELADELGCTVEEAKQKLATLAEAEEAKKDELTKAQEAAAAAKADAEAARAEAARIQREQMIDRKLVAAGVGSGHPADKRESVLTRARAALQLAADADAEAIDAEIQATVELIPGLIAPQGPVNGDQRPSAPSGVTSGAQPPPGGQPAKTAIERGRELARSRRPADPGGDPLAGIRTTRTA